MARVLTCDEGDYNVGTGECAAPYYAEQQTTLPTLELADAQAIGVACALLLGTAFVFKTLRKFLEQA